MKNDDLAEMLRSETWLSAKDALELGFIDEISNPVKAAASIDLTISQTFRATWPKPCRRCQKQAHPHNHP